MTIDEAIKILSDSYYKHTILLNGRDDEALNLGIEALKRYKLQRQLIICPSPPRLPGETKD
ncbi:unnamed protein product [marine sediment metagenome]|uniref:Uncharacterized protein n=1 Tax=marine sediment metagenome TaxID=412755 RepID=X1QU93_9ZZZZ